MTTRARKTRFSEWWWTLDRWLLAAVLLLLGIGFVLSFSASIPMALKRSLPPYYYVERHGVFLALSLLILLGLSFLDHRQVRRVSLYVTGGMFAGLIATLFVGTQVKGAARWLSFGPLSLQPSEFIKPAFVIVAAALMAEHLRDKTFPGNWLAIALLVGIVGLLLLQPDFGQTLLLLATWGGMFFIAGMPWFWILLTGAAAGGGLAAAYAALPHVQARIDGFLSGVEDNSQVDTALESISHGGWLGVGPGEGVIKNTLPDSHTDFIFSVAGEEFGIVLLLVLLALFAFIVVRGLRHALRQDDSFVRLAIAGLVIVFGLQGLINMAVNLHLVPPKGMTLPFISYGGSSLLAVAYGMGMLLALTKRRAQGNMVLRSTPFRPHASAGSEQA